MLCKPLRDHPALPKGGRTGTDMREETGGIPWVLNDGANWKELPADFGTNSPVHRAFLRWVKMGAFEAQLAEVGSMVELHDVFKIYECCVDGTFSKARAGGDGVGGAKDGHGVKMIIMFDANGLPIAVNTGSASPYVSRLFGLPFDFMARVDFPGRPIRDKAYDSDKLEQELADQGVDMIAPHPSNRHPGNKNQDGRIPRSYKRRRTVERIIGWLQNHRRLHIRWEKSIGMFQDSVNLACALLPVKKVLG